MNSTALIHGADQLLPNALDVGGGARGGGVRRGAARRRREPLGARVCRQQTEGVPSQRGRQGTLRRGAGTWMCAQVRVLLNI